VKGILTGLRLTFRTHWRRHITVQYPDERKPIAPRFRGFPGLTFDEEGELNCVGCEICQIFCPTEAIMNIKMEWNPRYLDGQSTRQKILETYQVDASRCIQCGICVEVCDFDALEMTPLHELASYSHEEMIKDRKAVALESAASATKERAQAR